MPKQPTTKPISLALQGGGAHGAYAWGVLDRLLEEEDIDIEGVSGTSAGAMNAAVMVNGYATGGRQGAREKLEQFWHKVSEVAGNPMNTAAFEQFLGNWNLSLSPMHHMMDLWTSMVSPYDTNPLNINPLKDVLEEVLEVDALRACDTMKLFISATHVKSGQVRVFNTAEMSVDVLLASACLPQMFQAVEIEGEHYWDGGYMGDPAIHPLIYHCDTADMVLVQITPIYRDDVPKQPIDITNRVNEINFNSSLIAEMRAIDFVKRLIKDGKLEEGAYKDMRVHRIYDPASFAELNASSKMNPSLEFFEHLKALGRSSCAHWINEHKKHIGKKSTVDIRDIFLCGTGMSSD